MEKLVGFADVSILLNPGIYVLCYKGSIEYVGSSETAFERLGKHWRNVVFDKVFFIPCPKEILLRMEWKYIHDLKPRLNLRRPGEQGSGPGVNNVPKRNKRIWVERKKRFSADGEVDVGTTLVINGKRYEIRKPEFERWPKTEVVKMRRL